MCKKSIKNSQQFVKKMKNVITSRGDFFGLTLYTLEWHGMAVLHSSYWSRSTEMISDWYDILNGTYTVCWLTVCRHPAGSGVQ